MEESTQSGSVATPGPQSLSSRTREGELRGPPTVLGCPLEVLHHGVVVNPAQDLLLHQAKLFPGGELPLAREAGEAGQVVGVASSPPHPVAGVDLPPAAGTFGTKPTEKERRSRMTPIVQNRGHFVFRLPTFCPKCRNAKSTHTHTPPRNLNGRICRTSATQHSRTPNGRPPQTW